MKRYNSLTEALTARPGDPEPARPEPLAVGMRELPALLSLSRRSIERLRSRGDFPPPDRRVGKISLWRVETIRRWLAEGGSR